MEKKHRVPITLNFDQSIVFGWAEIRDSVMLNADFYQGMVMAAAYHYREDGTIELLELSWIPAPKRQPPIHKRRKR